jgi:hypothetical protein
MCLPRDLFALQAEYQLLDQLLLDCVNAALDHDVVDGLIG